MGVVESTPSPYYSPTSMGNPNVLLRRWHSTLFLLFLFQNVLLA
jgi:hypothetical protein